MSSQLGWCRASAFDDKVKAGVTAHKSPKAVHSIEFKVTWAVMERRHGSVKAVPL